MANDKKWERTPYEIKFLDLLQDALDEGLNSGNMNEKNHIELYTKFYEAGQVFIEKIAIGIVCRAMLRGIRFDREEAACMCAEKFFFRHLDDTLASGEPEEIVKRLVKMVKNYIIDIVRTEKRHRYVPIDTFIDEEMKDETDVEENSEMYQTEADGETNAATDDEQDMDDENHAVAQAEHADWKHLIVRAIIADEDDLCFGDFVVHKKYGMGIYAGMEEKQFGGMTKRYVKIVYGENDFLLVPVENLEALAKYTGNCKHNATVCSSANKQLVKRTFAPNVQLEKGWDAIPSYTDLEKRAVDNEIAEDVLNMLKLNTNAFEVMSFLGTKLIGYKASELAEAIVALGKESVYRSVLRQTVDLFGLDCEFFHDAAFEVNNMALKYDDTKRLSAEISRGSDRAKNKVKNIYNKSK